MTVTKKKLLLVDDSMVMRMMIGNVLSDNGFEIVGQAQNGEDAYEMYKNLNPDLVTMDIVMPRENGLDAMKRIIDYDPQASIVIVSGLDQETMLVKALQIGAKDYIVKPFEQNELIKIAQKRAR